MQDPTRRCSLKCCVKSLVHLILIIAIVGLVILLLASYEVMLMAQAQVVRQQSMCTIKQFYSISKLPCHTALVQHSFHECKYGKMLACFSTFGTIPESCIILLHHLQKFIMHGSELLFLCKICCTYHAQCFMHPIIMSAESTYRLYISCTFIWNLIFLSLLA